MVQLDLRTVYLKHLHCTAQLRGRAPPSAHSFAISRQGLIRPLVGGVYKLSDFHRAQTDFMAKDFVGKLVVVPDAMFAGNR